MILVISRHCVVFTARLNTSSQLGFVGEIMQGNCMRANCSTSQLPMPSPGSLQVGLGFAIAAFLMPTVPGTSSAHTGSVFIDESVKVCRDIMLPNHDTCRRFRGVPRFRGIPWADGCHGICADAGVFSIVEVFSKLIIAAFVLSLSCLPCRCHSVHAVVLKCISSRFDIAVMCSFGCFHVP